MISVVSLLERILSHKQEGHLGDKTLHTQEENDGFANRSMLLNNNVEHEFPLLTTQTTFYFTCTVVAQCLGNSVKRINLTRAPSQTPNFSCFPSASLLHTVGSAFE